MVNVLFNYFKRLRTFTFSKALFNFPLHLEKGKLTDKKLSARRNFSLEGLCRNIRQCLSNYKVLKAQEWENRGGKKNRSNKQGLTPFFPVHKCPLQNYLHVLKENYSQEDGQL